MAGTKDRRTRRTRAAVLDAFTELFLNRRRPIRAKDLLAGAGVGRSTFYEHYSGPDEVLLEALRQPFAILADTAAGQGGQAATLSLVGHFWENRARARELFDNPRMRDRVSRLLAELVAERLADVALLLPCDLAATQLAEAALAPLRAWVRGEAPATAAAMAESLCRTGRALRGALSGAD
jgi:AcrR family transcriptional regulator